DLIAQVIAQVITQAARAKAAKELLAPRAGNGRATAAREKQPQMDRPHRPIRPPTQRAPRNHPLSVP
ncbi:MAG TPA: hypothetical protein VIG49_12300, partial [Acetobacteraceae bacterium]